MMSELTRPKLPEDGLGSGSIERGTPKISHNSSSQSSLWMSNSMVRLALV